MKVKYRRCVVNVDFERPKKCQCCGKERNKIDTHHYKYAHTTEEVRQNPKLALDYALFLCYNPCHRVADALRLIEEKQLTADKLKELVT